TEEVYTQVDDKYTDYKLLDNKTAVRMAAQNPANKEGCEIFNKIYNNYARLDKKTNEIVTISGKSKLPYICAGMGSNKINAYMRAKQSNDPDKEMREIFNDPKYQRYLELREESKELVNDFDKWKVAMEDTIAEVEKASAGKNCNVIEEKTRLFRLVGGDFLQYGLKLPKGIAIDDKTAPGSADEIVNAINKKAGTIIKDAGFMSTGYKPFEYFVSKCPIMLSMLVDKGKKCLVTNNFSQAEIIFGKDTRYMVVGAKVHGEKALKVPLSKRDDGKTSEKEQVGAFHGLEVIVKVLDDANAAEQDKAKENVNVREERRADLKAVEQGREENLKKLEKLVEEKGSQKEIKNLNAKIEVQGRITMDAQLKDLVLAQDKEIEAIKEKYKGASEDRVDFEVAAIKLRYAEKRMDIIKKLSDKKDYWKTMTREEAGRQLILGQLRDTIHFYDRRKEIYEASLKTVMKSRGIDPENKEKVDKEKVTVEEILEVMNGHIVSGEEGVYSRNDMLAEMEDRLIREDETASKVKEMLEGVYAFKDELGGSPILNMEKPRVDKRYSKFAVDKNGKKTNWGKIIKQMTTYESTSFFLDQFMKMAAFRPYISRDLMSDGEKQKADIDNEVTGLKSVERKRKIYEINTRYQTGKNTVAYLSRFFIHDAENGAKYEHLVMENVFPQLLRQYNYAKKLGTREAMRKFYQAIQGNCFDFVCKNIQEFDMSMPEALELENKEKGIKEERTDLIPDPGHGGIYIHSTNKLTHVTGEKGDDPFTAFTKIVRALHEEYVEGGGDDQHMFTWDDVHKEVCNYLAGNIWKNDKDASKPYDWSKLTPKQLLKDPATADILKNIRSQAEDWFLLDTK
ncbi:MAG: hypothetical protein K5989_09345, partial [Lachnospiraceae bacterium]|nr:hypothetical protein [Lachnospiraceae bacterium]